LSEVGSLDTLGHMEALELPPKADSAIKRFCADGDILAAAGKYKQAISKYNKAWKLVPVPKSEWNASTWILVAIADAAFLGGFKASAREALEYVMVCPDAVGNPFIHLRLGQVLYDMGEHDRAADELMRAYMGEGAEIFADEDGGYLTFLRTRAMLD